MFGHSRICVNRNSRIRDPLTQSSARSAPEYPEARRLFGGETLEEFIT
jgi:hypothetical protein